MQEVCIPMHGERTGGECQTPPPALFQKPPILAQNVPCPPPPPAKMYRKTPRNGLENKKIFS